MISPNAPPQSDTEVAYLRQRMRRPQRHRLLHGYPLAAAMAPRPAGLDIDVEYRPDAGRGLLVGVLPHPFCNPRVAGCGFCTFPHQPYDNGQAAHLAACVVAEIQARTRNQPSLRGRPIAALYFGGGTANLTPPAAFRDICRALAASFDLSQAEVTLEGVPAYFVKRRPPLMDVMREELQARHFRVSMGIQTFDQRRLRQMGREAFGDAATFAEVVEAAHARGFTASADLLFNLPHQTLAQMKRDLARADALGLDHLGLYHLVLFRGLGTDWSRDEEMLAGLPGNEEAADNWLALREQMLGGGFYQTTLTNFERVAFRGSERRFVYEEHSFRVGQYDMIGFGPGGISFAASADCASGLKLLNPDGAAEYAQAAARNATAPWGRHFSYGPEDMRVFYLVRRLAALEISMDEYERMFGMGTHLTELLSEVLALEDEGLVEVSADDIVRPTPRGMFYADSIASLFTRRALRERRGERAPERVHDNGRGHM